MFSRRSLLAFLIGVAVLVQPVVGNGPGPDPQYTYEVTPVSLSNDEMVESMYSLPEVAYSTGPKVEVTRNAVNTTVSRPEGTIDAALRSMTDVQFLADDVDDQYYRIDARITNGTFRLDATPVSARRVAEELVIAPENAHPLIQESMDGKTKHFRRVHATLVAKDDRFLLVQSVETELVPDPLVVAKLIVYTLGMSLIVWAVVTSTK
jgi:hypothetical protein